VPEASLGKPPLITIEIIKKLDSPTLEGDVTVVKCTPTIEGKLLDHSGGAWYIFNNQDDRLTVIPDAQVSEVQVKGNA